MRHKEQFFCYFSRNRWFILGLFNITIIGREILMSIKIYYSFENTGATWAKPKLDKSTGKISVKKGSGDINYSSDVEGSCFGYSLDWASRMVQYKGDVEKSRPNKGIGTALQQRFEMKFKGAKGNKLSCNSSAVSFMVNNVSLSMADTYQCAATDIADKVDGDNSVIVFDNGLHWMGMAKVNGTRFYFDSNDGLYSASTIEDYRKLVNLFVDDYKSETNYTSTWDVYSVKAG